MTILCLFCGMRCLAEIPAGKTAPERMRSGVEFLCDSICDGRACGSAGSSEAAFYMLREMQHIGLAVRVQSFQMDSLTGHNIIGVIRGNRSSDRYILVVAYYDGMGSPGGNLLPGADANASGAVLLLELARRLKDNGHNYVFAALDAHNRNLAGAEALHNMYPSPLYVINLDTVGSIFSPPSQGQDNYLIALGGKSQARLLEAAARGAHLMLYYDYYGSDRFTELFYHRISDHKYWLSEGIPCLMFTSGISMRTNKPSDSPVSLNYGMMSRRADLIENWIKSLQ